MSPLILLASLLCASATTPASPGTAHSAASAAIKHLAASATKAHGSASQTTAHKKAEHADTIKLADRAVEHKAVQLTLLAKGLPVAGVKLQVAYRENAHKDLQHQQHIGPSDAQGRIEWTPEEAGVVVFSWPGGKKNISVFYDGLPWSGLLVMLFAGFLLLGGTVFFFAQMLRAKEQE